MADTKKEAARFRVTQAPGFFDGSQLHVPGTELEWEVPSDWDAEKNGPHAKSFGPSASFEPLNEVAVALQKHHAEHTKKLNQPPTNELDELKKQVAKQNEQLNDLLKSLLEERAAARREAESKKR